jgi:hypothetical protein
MPSGGCDFLDRPRVGRRVAFIEEHPDSEGLPMYTATARRLGLEVPRAPAVALAVVAVLDSLAKVNQCTLGDAIAELQPMLAELAGEQETKRET